MITFFRAVDVAAEIRTGNIPKTKPYSTDILVKREIISFPTSTYGSMSIVSKGIILFTCQQNTTHTCNIAENSVYAMPTLQWHIFW
jgi:hypothetical protein